MNATTDHKPVVYAVVLNWNGWRDTIACLDSVLRSDYPNLRVIVCDNGSTDDSYARIRDWAAGRLAADGGEASATGGHGAVTPLPFAELDQPTAAYQTVDSAYRLMLIQNGANLGFAGGNNVGVRHALAADDCDHVWLLNNDTRVESDALDHMVRRLAAEPAAGLCGATLVDYEAPHRVQALGGARYNPWLGTVAPIGAGRRPNEGPSPQAVESAMDYVIGACMLVTRDWLETVGLLSEDYFLYFEEIDWASRAAGRYKQVFAPDSIVYHRNGATIGGPADSAGMDGLALRNRLRYTVRHRLWALPTVWLGMLGVLLRRMQRRQWHRVPVVLAVMFGIWRGPA